MPCGISVLPQHRDARHDAVGDADRVLAFLLGDGESHGRELPAVAAGDAMPDIALGRQRSIGDGCHVLQEHGLPLADGNDQLTDVSRVAQDRDPASSASARSPDRRSPIGAPRLAESQRLTQLGDRHSRASHAPRVDLDANCSPLVRRSW
jgi:hypothetical protein